MKIRSLEHESVSICFPTEDAVSKSRGEWPLSACPAMSEGHLIWWDLVPLRTSLEIVTNFTKPVLVQLVKSFQLICDENGMSLSPEGGLWCTQGAATVRVALLLHCSCSVGVSSVRSKLCVTSDVSLFLVHHPTFHCFRMPSSRTPPLYRSTQIHLRHSFADSCVPSRLSTKRMEPTWN